MTPDTYDTPKAFYRAVLDVFGARYPHLFESDARLFKVLHAFEDKIPLVDALLERDLLAGVVLKKSSSETQTDVAYYLEERLREHDLLMDRSETTYGQSIPSLSRRAGEHPLIIGDHGGYYAHILPSLVQAFGPRALGITEHTLNGEERVLHQFQGASLPFGYFSTAKLDLKERSDREIAQAIAREIVRYGQDLGKDLLSRTTPPVILLDGYGQMGMFAAQELKSLGFNGELIVTDISLKKCAFAVQDGHVISHVLEDILPRADIVILATNIIRGKPAALMPAHFSLLKKGAAITSFTSLDDEADQNNLIRDGHIRLTGFEGPHGVYKGPTDEPFYLMQNGRPANVGLPDGGAGNSICLVEAAGLAGAFVVAQQAAEKSRLHPPALSDEDADILAGLWLQHFHGSTRPALN